MNNYLLTNHAYICLTRDGAVLLDLQRDEYIGFGAAETRALAQLVTAWPKTPSIELACADTMPDLGEIEAELLKRNILTTSSVAGKKPNFASCIPPAETVRMDLAGRPSYTVKDALNAASASIVAKAALRMLPLSKVVERVRSRKESRTKAAAFKSSSCQLTTDLVSIFRSLRPFFYTARDHCLFDSLALIEFLSRYDVYPDWIFGVVTAPFAAHCWVQQDGLVLNTTLEEASSFAPILVI